jgi:ABC-2 type transport system ATP-binding protein
MNTRAAAPGAGAFSLPDADAESPSSPALQVDELTKVYRGGVRANDGITLAVAQGEVYGLLGPNGAGKSTLVRQVIGLLAPTSGRIALDGHDLVRHPAAARQLCSYLPQAQLPIDGFRVREAIELSGAIRGGRRGDVRRRAEELVDGLQLREWEHDLGTKLSGGVKRLVGFAMAAVRPGRLVVLDEPTNDVDPLRRRLLWREVRRLADGGCAVLLVTHNVLEAEKTVDRVGVLDAGRVVAEGTPSALKRAEQGRLRLHLVLAPGAPTPALPAFVERHARSRHDLMTVIGEPEAAAAVAWAQELLGAGAAEEYALGATTLEDVYIRLTGRVPGSGEAP